jgi:hypothetical protein
METCRLALQVKATGADLTLIVRLDSQEIWRGKPVLDWMDINCEFADTADQEHVLEIELQHKLPEHTSIDESGNILSDRVIELQNISLDDIQLGQIFTQLATYQHDFNGSQPMIQDQFFGSMGCNGTVRLKFVSPVYLWLLENM